MRRAALAAIAVLLLLLLLLDRDRTDRSLRRDPAAAADAAAPPPAPDSAPTEAARAPDAAEPEPGTASLGLVTNSDGKPLAGLRVVAISRDEAALWDAEDPFTPPGGEPLEPFAHTDAEGRFAFQGLPPGDYRLTIDDTNWMLEKPVFFRARASDIRVVAERAWLARIRARDLATSEPIPRFLVRYRWPLDGRDERTAEGTGGELRLRLRKDALEQYLSCRVEAEGYLAGSVSPWSKNAATGDAWLARDVEPFLALRVLFEDGAPCEESGHVHIWHRRGPRHAFLPAVRVGSGLYRAAVPPGSWHVVFVPLHSTSFGERPGAAVEIGEGERREVFLELQRGGDVVVTRGGWDGRPWWLQVLVVPRRGHQIVGGILVEAAEQRMTHLAPGTYRFFAPRLDGTPTSGHEVDVTTGSRHELTIE